MRACTVSQTLASQKNQDGFNMFHCQRLVVSEISYKGLWPLGQVRTREKLKFKTVVKIAALFNQFTQ